MNFAEHEIIGSKVEVRNLVKQFGELKAVDQISLSIDGGTFLTLLGPSGSGKTTTLNLIAGFETLTSGEVFVDGKPISDKPPYKRNIGIVFQNYALFPHMTVSENIAFPLQMRGLTKDSILKEIKSALQMVQLQGYENRYPKLLSGGQQQRIALARALVFRPPLLLMDEPLGALDKKLREQMQIEIKHIQKHLGITVIYVTHDQQEALTMSDRIAILNHGQLEQESFPQDLYERPRSRFVADFIGETNLLDGNVFKDGDQLLVEIYGLATRFVLPSVMGSVLGDVSVSIRPEKLEIGCNRTDHPCFRGEIEEIIYIGESTKYILKTPGEIKITHQNCSEPLPFKRGDRVMVSFNPTDMTIFRKE